MLSSMYFSPLTVVLWKLSQGPLPSVLFFTLYHIIFLPSISILPADRPLRTVLPFPSHTFSFLSFLLFPLR
ncbi:hypothetical protein BACCAP_00269 [Pseudoflavonifractor capillosus ATCC 29799]|uniref:Uncharacterized protein n=1 Tax=Pseudoflavonifractor capillosus ATCC 29799 TaxID=411467 RepID=A6NQ01_9FIRM|nr:hypothetical protein BACCAP_00269 [Pseudoflavonifractor capillosus ATCC 29799]